MAFGWIGGLIWLLILGGIAWAVVNALQKSGNPSRQTPERSDAVEILKRRFASGEIDAEEYRKRLSVLEN